MRVALNSLRSVHSSRSRTRSTVARPWARSLVGLAGVAVHQPDEDGAVVAGDERGHAPHAGPGAAASCSLRTTARASPDVDGLGDGAGVGGAEVLGEGGGDDVGVSRCRPWSWRMAKRARCTAGKASGKPVADGDAGPQGPQAAVVVGAVPDRGSPSSTWIWPSENGMNVTSQSAPPARPASRCSWALRANGQR